MLTDLPPSPVCACARPETQELCLYWLIYSEAANLRHTPEMLWFIFHCAQHSWQAKQASRWLMGCGATGALLMLLCTWWM